ncbi:MAG: rane protein [Microbacteriaceae bacterium]|nr:rane protein [Microbacteriaceae bacterium]
MDPTRRLMFWLKLPFIADAALVVIGVLLLVGGNTVGWWVLLFAGIRAAVGAISVWVIAPRVLGRPVPPDQSPST